jgi:hypothetical protein
MTMINEQTVQKLLKKYKFKPPFHLVACHYWVRWEDEILAEVDCILKKGGQAYAVEIKGVNHKTDSGNHLLWKASKILAVTKILNCLEAESYIPSIMLPEEKITSTVLAICFHLGIALFGYSGGEGKKALCIKNYDLNKMFQNKRSKWLSV